MQHIRGKPVTTRTIRLKCHECNETFEVSNSVADAMHHWRAESGDPFLCVDCATQIAWGDAIQRWTENAPALLKKTLSL